MKRKSLTQLGRTVKVNRSGKTIQKVRDPTTWLTAHGYNYLGPNMHRLDHAYINEFPPKNWLDKLALQHDIAYQNVVDSGVYTAFDTYTRASLFDDQFINNIENHLRMNPGVSWNEWYAAEGAMAYFRVKGRYATRMARANVEEEKYWDDLFGEEEGPDVAPYPAAYWFARTRIHQSNHLFVCKNGVVDTQTYGQTLRPLHWVCKNGIKLAS